MSTLQVVNAKHPSSASNNLVLDASGNATFAGTAAMASSFLRNRLINGDMRIDQRNAGASVTPGNAVYTLDRWRFNSTQTSKFSVQQNAGSVTPPPGFTNYLGVTSLSAYALTGVDSFSFEQIIEGFNVSDLNWGTANALPATLSFWVRSSLTGTFGGSLATTRTAVWVMPFSFTISAANTWTYVTVSVTAPTSTGGANTGSSDGVYVRFGLGGTGAVVGGTVGVWTNAGNFIQPAGTVSVVGTNGATLYVTGVQFEVGSVATPFERRQFGQELALCQRYFQKTFPLGTVPASITGTAGAVFGSSSVTNTSFSVTRSFLVQMRASPTMVFFSPNQAGSNWSEQSGVVPTLTDLGAIDSSISMRGTGSISAGGAHSIHFTASAEL